MARECCEGIRSLVLNKKYVHMTLSLETTAGLNRTAPEKRTHLHNDTQRKWKTRALSCRWVRFSGAVLFCQPHQQLFTHSFDLNLITVTGNGRALTAEAGYLGRSNQGGTWWSRFSHFTALVMTTSFLDPFNFVVHPSASFHRQQYARDVIKLSPTQRQHLNQVVFFFSFFPACV